MTIPLAILDASREPISYEEADILALMLFDASPLWLGLVGFAVVFAVVARTIEVRRKPPPAP